ncbi:hypothetical protein [Streptomyces wuyuanensis]|uniref:hypothetical protein n=1 Tax=Streptomyces wuyuanensis TaxID=1196353 RepID=UPI0037217920
MTNPFWRPGGLGLRDTADRDAPPRTGQTLETVMRACADDYAARPDFSRLLATAKARETAKLRKWLADIIPDAERDDLFPGLDGDCPLCEKHGFHPGFASLRLLLGRGPRQRRRRQ